MTTRSVRRLSVIAAAAASVLGVAATAAPAATAAANGTVTITNTMPRWLGSATPDLAPQSATKSSPLSVRVYLNPTGGLDALKATVAAVSDPASAQYRHFLSSAQFDAAYAPSAAAVSSLRSYLRGQGVHVDSVEAHRRYVSATADRATLAKAFGTELGSFVHNGESVTAPTRAVTLPAAVGANVLTVTGLDTSSEVMRHHDSTAEPAATQPPAGFRNARPCNIDYGVVKASLQGDGKTPLPLFGNDRLPYAPCGYTGPSFRAAYEGNTSLSGAGVTVAITDAYAWQFIASDANRYASAHGDGSYFAGQLTQSLPSSFRAENLCVPSGWAGEETLDVEAVHAMAPSAKIRYYGSRSCLNSDFVDTLARVVDENTAQIVSNSWGGIEEGTSSASIAANEQVFLQGAMQGISFLFSSGDSGDELARTGIKQADYPSSDPYITAAGGTSTAIAFGRLVGQTGWGTENYVKAASNKGWVGTGFLYGAGGGFSTLFNRPDYQLGTVPASAPAGRAVPDIAMDGDPNTGMLIGITQTFPEGVHYGEYRLGGTSLASPLLAGMTALKVQQSGGGLGLLNPMLYSSKGSITDVLASGMPDRGVVRVNFNNGVDTTAGVSYVVRTFNEDSSLNTSKGWDPVTGIGVPNPSYLTAAKPAA